MLWSERRRKSKSATRAVAVAILLLVLLASAPSAEEKQLSVYGPRVSYSLPVIEHNGQDYVGLLEALEPMGSVGASADGDKWKLRFNNMDAEFRQQTTLGKVAGQSNDSGYREGSTGTLQTGNGQGYSLGGDGIKAQITQKVCDQVLQHAKSFL